ncbi:MAG TPA: hypothetical protein VEA63_13065 [Opitutus sp.]|nr:hypothetical protein [Opitutus sp.]
MPPTSAAAPALEHICVSLRRSSATFDGAAFVGTGRAMIDALATHLQRPPLDILDRLVKGLLVNKGAHWTSTIVGEYLHLYAPSAGNFCVVAEREAGLVRRARIFARDKRPRVSRSQRPRTRLRPRI